MRATLFYTMLAMMILNAADSAGEVAAGLKPAAGTPAIGAVKLESMRLVTQANQSELIESDVSIGRVSVGNPNLIEVVAVRNRELVVKAKAAGETTLIVWSAAGRKPFNASGSAASREGARPVAAKSVSVGAPGRQPEGRATSMRLEAEG